MVVELNYSLWLVAKKIIVEALKNIKSSHNLLLISFDKSLILIFDYFI